MFASMDSLQRVQPFIVGSVHCILHQDLGLELGFLDCHILELLLPLQLGLNSSELVLELGDLELELLVLLGGATVCRRRRRTKTCKHATFSNVWDSAWASMGHERGCYGVCVCLCVCVLDIG